MHLFPSWRTPVWPLIVVVGACSGERAAHAPEESAATPMTATPPPGAEAISFLGDTLFPPKIPEATFEVYLERYREAEDVLAENPEDADALIWLGRRTAYLGRYREAIEIYTYALTLHPDDARIYRHRGHRYLTVREPDNAIADFHRAAELNEGRPDVVEPDGLPNRLGIPTSTQQSNTWYHLGLAHYVRGEFEQALQAYRSGMAVPGHPDSFVATSYWLYLTLRRLGMKGEAEAVLAAISEDLEIIESTAYLDVLLLFKGERTLEDFAGEGGDVTLESTTTAYGVGAWHMLNGREAEAEATWRRVLESRNQWAVFGYLAAEAELARSGG